MDDRLKRRVITFYVAGILNAFFGVYILFEGGKFIPQETAMWLVVLCLVFAGVNFYMAYALKKAWEENQARLRGQRPAPGTASDAKK